MRTLEERVRQLELERDRLQVVIEHDDAKARAAAAALVRRARADGRRAWCELGMSLERAQRLAERHGADRLVHVRADAEAGDAHSTQWCRVGQKWHRQQQEP